MFEEKSKVAHMVFWNENSILTPNKAILNLFEMHA
jgi:hypothetical protein